MKKLSIFLMVILICLNFIFCSKPDESAQPANDPDNPAKPAVPVEVMVVRLKPVEEMLPLTGILNPIYEVEIIAEVTGQVEKVYKKLGESVSKENILALIDDEIALSQYHQAKAQVLSAETNLGIAELNLKSDEELYKNGDISKVAYENSVLAVKTAKANQLSALANLSLLKKQYNDTRIKSPISGLISRKYIDVGTFVTPNMPVYRVVDISTMKIEVGIPQSAITYIRKGSEANITISSLDNRMFKGEVKYISPQSDENTGTFTAEIQVKNTPDLEFKAGMTVKVDLKIMDFQQKLVIPDYAVITQDGNNSVYKIKKETAHITPIIIEESIGSQIIIGEGLAEGDTIVVVGIKNLGKRSKVWIETVH